MSIVETNLKQQQTLQTTFSQYNRKALKKVIRNLSPWNGDFLTSCSRYDFPEIK